MKRLVYFDLLEWRDSSIRKPLLLRGARQVGKTHAVRQFGKTFEHYVEINFEKQPELINAFTEDLDPVHIIRKLLLAMDKTIIPGQTLLFIDEIQEYPRAILALRYFYEEMPDLHVIAAGSLVDFAIEQVGVPVGRISFLYMYPMSFIEYLCARGSVQLASAIIEQDVNHPMSEVIHQRALKLLAEYMAVGGMPQVIYQLTTQQDIRRCGLELQDIKDNYEQDFIKYAKKNVVKYVDLLFRNIPRFIGQRFKYSHLESSYRKRELEPALWLLEKAGIIYRVLHTNGNGIPLGAEMDLSKFKLITVDVGLNQAILNLELKDWFLNPLTTFINKGSLTENFIGQELLAYSNFSSKQQLYYWHREEKSSSAEVDYLIVQQQKIIPIEVKSGYGNTMRSMQLFLQSHPDSPYGIRFSIHNYSVHDKIHSYPLYAVAAAMGDKEKLLEFLREDEK